MADAPEATPSNWQAVIQHNMSQPAANDNAGGGDAGGAEGDEPAPFMDALNDDTWPDGGGDGDTPDVPEDAFPVLEDDSEGEGQEASEETAEGDEPRTTADPEIHGLKQSEVLKAIKEGTLPAELAKAVKVAVKINGEESHVSAAEAAKGYQRLSDYSRKMAEARQVRNEAQDTIDNVGQMFERWKDPSQLKAGIKRLGLWDAFHQLAYEYAKEQYQEEKLRQENPHLYEVRQELKREREAREQLEAKLNAPKPDAKRQQKIEEFTRQVQPLITSAFERLQINDSPMARQAFRAAFNEFYDPSADLTEVVDNAAQATAEYLSDLAAKHQAANPPKDQPPKPPSPRSGAAPAAPSKSRSSRKAMTPSQFMASLRK